MKPRVALSLGIIANLGILIYFKYAYFIAENLTIIGLEATITEGSIILPIGISFYTFQSISYLIDVYRKTVPAQKNLIRLGLYISLFPQLIAGPIVRYENIHKEIIGRTVSRQLFVSGILKFIRGLTKKVVIANTAALIADTVFGLPTEEIGMKVAWVGILCYTIQIYFDFSGYSDMAIGLGRMFGFHIKENFLHPYKSKSIQEFWRRWHVSLSTWFRDYLYIPLGGNRVSKMRLYANLILVFFITGLWHGASWSFIVWGLFHGIFLLLERNYSISLPNGFQWLRNIYLLLVVIVGWVFFRAENLSYAIDFLGIMVTGGEGANSYPLFYINNYSILILLTGVLFSFPIREKIIDYLQKKVARVEVRSMVSYSFHLGLLLYSALEVVQSNYNPFIYFRF
ncbi:MBOAT family O-acyltransferase [Luteirhabdus pelagi]|uniref:MBOAT family O-acyltransferase n=1 Tax=Luteirhabdus pelagi TaxID=2792783 RepID=UPI00193A6282|nr:MBOAT family O-acyltransferase [Luteirhabdus pelagi]